MRIVFAGSPAAAVPSLRALASSDHRVVAVVTREDSPQGRRRVLTPTPVAVAAAELSIPVLRANRLTDSISSEIAALDADLGVIVAYGALVREPLLSTPRLGWINLHFSLLPRWRGAAPVQHAIIAGDEHTGATVFQLVPELDAGDILGQLGETIGGMQTAGALLEELAVSGADLVVRVVDALESGAARPVPQVGEVTLAPKLSLEDGRIDWSEPASSVHNRVRGVTPEPGAFTMVGDDRVKVLATAIARDALPLPAGEIELRGKTVHIGTGTEPIELLTVQPAGRTAMDAAAWWRGRPPGSVTSAS
ncbi:methionyl-tRNA formyltransferase [Salinibacterium soli]|uniref:Methionyl-tRNA formyltransferase n=1 Tax=Antiquaquibacter soli TaxID=3064523 RepID=A0ABT9BN58_9MICO|nr:methionyl-tRNA formyltransferase [Protaetiibacter sp. WY-16]MDO7882009.1 methionyl-tRNA formyltransferase [Protaetiibacter sp. WY-16]